MSSASTLATLAGQLRLDAQNPWPGLAAFTESQQEFFFGRNEDAADLYSCIRRERLTLLFGKSGLGKTSLLQAGLFPRLRAASMLPVYIRLGYGPDSPPLEEQVQAALEAAVASADLAEAATPQSGEGLWEYLHRRGGNFIGREGSAVTPVLVLDQFEEWFTLGARRDFAGHLAKDFLPGLAGLVENRTPARLAERLMSDRDVGRRYDLESLGCRILITLREDYLPSLESLRDSIPSLAQAGNRMRLTEMNGSQALSVVADPNPDLIDPGVAEYIVRFVAGVQPRSGGGPAEGAQRVPLESLEIAPAILCLFCRQLNEERLSRNLPRITESLVSAQGLAIIDDFYRQSIAGMHPAVRRLIEDRLLTSAGFRDSIDLAEAGRDLEQAGADPASIDSLIRIRLLQVEEHRGHPRLELTHDVLAEPVRRSRDQWAEEQAREKRRQQELDALAAARKAEQDALRRARGLQKVIAATSLVAIVLAGLLVAVWMERRKAIANAASLRTMTSTAQTAEAQAKSQATIATQNADKAKNYADSVSKLSTQYLEHCVNVSSAFYNAGQSSNGDTKKVALQFSEMLLMGSSDSCFSVAQKLHGIAPDNMEITDDLAMIPLVAADAASQRDDAATVQKDVNAGIQEAAALEKESAKPKTQILIARSYARAAYEMVGTGDNALTTGARPLAARAVSMAESLSPHLASDALTGGDWDRFRQACMYTAGYYEDLKNVPDAARWFNAAINAEQQAIETDPKDFDHDKDLDSVLRDTADFLEGRKLWSQALPYRKHAVTLLAALPAKAWDSERTDLAKAWLDLAWTEIFDKHFPAGVTDARRGVVVARGIRDDSTLDYIYKNTITALAGNDDLADARTLSDERIKEFRSHPANNDSRQYLALAYTQAASVDEDLKDWGRAVSDRQQEVALYTTLNDAKAYDSAASDLDIALARLSLDEIYDKQFSAGVADARRGAALAVQLKDDSTLDDIFNSAVNALVSNGDLPDARTLSDQRIHHFEAEAVSNDSQRYLARAYAASGSVDEAMKDWPRSVADRTQAVTLYTALSEKKAYDSAGTDLATALGNLSWAEIQDGQFAPALAHAQKGFALDPTATWIEVNEAHALLFTGQVADARALYMKFRTMPRGENRGDGTLAVDVASDYQQLCSLGYVRPEMPGIIHDLGVDNPDLLKCLSGGSAPVKTPAPVAVSSAAAPPQAAARPE